MTTATAVPPPVSAVGSWREPCVPEKKITGSTGRMHGEKPVIRPPRKPISASVNMSVIRSRNAFGLVKAKTPGHARVPGASASLDYAAGGISTVSIMYT